MLVEIKTGSFLAIQIADIEDIFEQSGDAETWSLLQDFQRAVERHLHRRSGILVDNVGGVLLASFPDPVGAIETACELGEVLKTEFPQREWILSGALHRGPALVTGDRNEVRYFGATINKTLRAVQNATAGHLLLTRSIWSDPGVTSAFGSSLEPIGQDQIANCEAIQQIALNHSRPVTGDTASQ